MNALPTVLPVEQAYMLGLWLGCAAGSVGTLALGIVVYALRPRRRTRPTSDVTVVCRVHSPPMDEATARHALAWSGERRPLRSVLRKGEL